jgi:hypothetical protein
MIDSVDLVLLGLAALLAGFIDAVAGGGGLKPCDHWYSDYCCL